MAQKQEDALALLAETARQSPDLGAAAPRGLADQSEARAPALASGEASFVTGSELVIDYRALIFTSGNIPSTSPFITGC
jgi:hypothetical protein